VTPQSIVDDVGAPTLATPIAVDLAEAVRPLTILGRMAALRRVPHSVRLISAATGTTGNWTGENKSIPMSAMDWDTASLQPLKVNALSAITSELARSSAPSADMAIARDVVAACALAVDAAFIDPENTGTANAKPASITSAATSRTSSGNTLANIDSDLRDAVGVLDAADANIDSAVWVLRGRSAAYLSTLRGSGGNLAYPTMGLRGGSLLGLPALVSNAVPMDSNSPTESSLTLVCASEVSGSSLASLIHRARAEFDRHADASAKLQGSALASARTALLSFTTRQAMVHKIELEPDALAQLSDSILDVILQPACPTCAGVAYAIIANTARLSANACPTCSGTGRRWVRCEAEGGSKLAREVSSSIATKLDHHAAKLGKFLRHS
jgi:hypothetical protein